MNAFEGPPPKWPVLSSTVAHDLIIFRARRDVVRSPRTDKTFERMVLETPHWVNVVAVTQDGHVVLVHQHRFGTGELTVEIPGGMIDPGEDPAHAAARELREETGFVGDLVSLGFVEPNPAFHDNRCYMFLAKNAVRSAETSFDPGEDITIELRPLAAVRDAIATGEIAHSLVICALSRVLDLRGPHRVG